MKNRRVIIIGGSGFIGRHIVKRLAAQGAVVAVVSPHASDATYLRPMGDVGQIAMIDARITDAARLGPLLSGADAVISAAGIQLERGRATFDFVHREGPATLAKLAKAAGVKHFVHVSGIGADPESPSPYMSSKGEGEAAVRAEFPDSVILRPSLVFGPEDQFFNRFAVLARYSPVLPLIGGGTARLQPVFVGDVADAVIAGIEKLEARGRVYELGGPRDYTVRELMTLVLQEVRRQRALVPVPVGLASAGAMFAELLPAPPITRGQTKLMVSDNLVTPGAAGLLDLGITPTALELVLPLYLERFRRGGRFAESSEAAKNYS